MKKFVKSMMATVILVAMAFAAGCNKPDDPNGEENGGNDGGDTPDPGEVINGPDLMTFTVNGVSFDMVKVEGGTFWMGAQSTNQNGQNYDENANESEAPVHQVALSDYYIGKYEVSQELWQAVMGTTPSHFQGELLPVENVSYNAVQDFMRTLNARLSNETNGLQFRLPSEAQWEFAAKGGKQSHGYKYSGSNDISAVAWMSGSHKTHPIGSKEPNELFLYDMSGNVGEWCNDYAGGYAGASQTDPIGPSQEFMGDNPSWIVRGGSWASSGNECRSSSRSAWNTGEDEIGFRLVLSGSAGQATVPGPRTGIVGGVMTNSAKVSGSLLTDGGSHQTEWGFYYGISSDLATNGTKVPVTEYGQNHNFSTTLTNLQSGTKYYVCAYAKNAIGTGYGETVEFTTPIEVITMEVSEITISSAVIGGTIPNTNITITERGVCYGLSNNPTHTMDVDFNGDEPIIHCAYVKLGSGPGSFTHQLSSLWANTIYYARAYAILSNDIICYGDIVSFTTMPPQVPTVETISAYYGVDNGYGIWHASGKILSDGGASINYNKVGFIVSTNPYSTWNGGNYNGNFTWSGGNTGSGEFSDADCCLELNTTYYVRAFATNSVGVGYGEAIEITPVLPPATIETFPVTEITSNSAVCGGNVSTTGEIMLRGICWSTSPNPVYFDDNTLFANGTTGSFSFTMTGLSPNTTYYVRAFASGNIQGICGYGETQVFTTLP